MRVPGCVPQRLRGSDSVVLADGTVHIVQNQTQSRIMNATLSNPNLESRWRTYLKGAAFVTPAIVLWAFASVFLFPKLKTIWVDAGFAESSAIFGLRLSDFFMEHGVLLAAGVIGLCGLLEWRWSRWPRYRRGCVGTGVFVLNTAVLVLMTGMLLAALLAAPALMARR